MVAHQTNHIDSVVGDYASTRLELKNQSDNAKEVDLCVIAREFSEDGSGASIDPIIFL